MQPRLRIVILARKPQVVGHGSSRDLGLPKGQIGGLPDHGTAYGDQLLRGAEVVVDKIIGAGVGLIFLQDHRLPIQINILPQYGSVYQRLGDELVVEVVEIVSGGCAHGLADAAVAAVVAVGGHGCTLFFHLDDPVQAVVGKGEGPVCDHVAIGVIGRGLRGGAGGSGQLVVGGVVAVIARLVTGGRGLDSGNPGHMACGVTGIGVIKAPGLDPGDIVALIVISGQID